MSADEVPMEIANSPPVNETIRSHLTRMFGATKMVAIHDDKGLVATWSGGTGVNVYDLTALGSDHRRLEVYHGNFMDTPTEDDVHKRFTAWGFEVL